MKQYGKKLAEAVAFAIVMILIAWFDGSIDPSEALRPLWFQVSARFLIYTAIFFVVGLAVDALFKRFGRQK